MGNTNYQYFIKFYTYLLSILCLITCQKNNLQHDANLNLSYKSLDQVKAMMEEGSITSEVLTRYYIDKIKLQDGTMKSVIIINPDALEIAMVLDKERKQGNVRGPLHGIPILIKDNIDTRDKMPNTAGSFLLANNYPMQDAFIVKKLRDAGAVIIGKTNLSEWANFRSTKSNSGWSSQGGQTRNFHNNALSPCGSSAGTGVAIAADFAVLGIGTETNGSIACPSAVNGIVGLKPTVGLWSRAGIIPISKTQDTAGPMCRSVKDAATLLSICAGIDPIDQATSGIQNLKDYTQYCVEGSLSGKRIGIDTSYLNLTSDLGKVFKTAVQTLKANGAQIIETNHRAVMSTARGGELDILLYEFKDGVNAYLKDKEIPYKTLKDLIAGNEANKSKTMPIFGQELFLQAEEKGSLQDAKYLNAIDKTTKKYRYLIDSVMTAMNLDAFAGPTLGHAWVIDYVNGDRFNGPASYGFAAVAGYPHITLPMGKVNNLPVGICFVGKKWGESTIISMAYDYERKR
jgi:amidase